MTLTIESPRFGRVEIDPDTVIEFPEGLIGLGGSRYALLTSDPDSPLMWLHCVDDPSLSLPVAEPQLPAQLALGSDDDIRQAYTRDDHSCTSLHTHHNI